MNGEGQHQWQGDPIAAPGATAPSDAVSGRSLPGSPAAMAPAEWPQPHAPVERTFGSLLTVTPLPGVAGLRLLGEVDMSSHEVLAEALHDLVARGSGDVVLDLGDLTFIDVGGVALLARVARGLGPGRRLVVRHPPRFFRRILTLLWGQRHAIEVQGS